MHYIPRFHHLVLFLVVAFFIAFALQACGSEEKMSRNAEELNLSETKGHNKEINGDNEHQVIVYYFHGNNRCHTCRRIEQLTKQAVTESFAKELETGLLKMKIINVDEADNAHFSKDYQLFTRSVVVSGVASGEEKQWKNLQKVWELVHAEKAFKAYIRNEIQAYLS